MDMVWYLLYRIKEPLPEVDWLSALVVAIMAVIIIGLLVIGSMKE